VRRPRPPLFLAPDRYRRRRLMDGARMLPVAGAFLLLLPILWRPTAEGHHTAAEGLYLFGVWGVLILAARLLSRPLLSTEDDPPPDQGDPAAAAGGDSAG